MKGLDVDNNDSYYVSGYKGQNSICRNGYVITEFCNGGSNKDCKIPSNAKDIDGKDLSAGKKVWYWMKCSRCNNCRDNSDYEKCKQATNQLCEQIIEAKKAGRDINIDDNTFKLACKQKLPDPRSPTTDPNPPKPDPSEPTTDPETTTDPNPPKPDPSEPTTDPNPPRPDPSEPTTDNDPPKPDPSEPTTDDDNNDGISWIWIVISVVIIIFIIIGVVIYNKNRKK